MKTSPLTTIGIAVLLFLLLVSWRSGPWADPEVRPMNETAEQVEDTQHVLTQLGHFTDDLHSAFMAVKLGIAVRKAGAEVTLFVNLEGIRAIDSRQPLNMRWGHTKTFAAFYDEFVEKGGAVVACPHCAKAVGIEDDRLRDSAVVATEDELAALILSADKVVDY